MSTEYVILLIVLGLYPFVGLMLLALIIRASYVTGVELARKGAVFSPEEVGSKVQWLEDRVKFFKIFWMGYNRYSSN